MLARVRAVLSVLLGDARRHRLQTATTLVGMAVGVAVVVAIRLASDAALDSFRRSYAELVGQATHELTAREPLPAARLAALAQAPGVLACEPVIETTLVVLPHAPAAPVTLRLFGVDPFLARPFLPPPPSADEQVGAQASVRAGAQDAARDRQANELLGRLLLEPGFALLPPGTLAAVGLPQGGRLTARGPHGEITLTVAELPASILGAPPDVPLALTDIATAQELLGLGDRVLRFDLILAGGADASAIPLLPGERLERPERRGERADTITAAFRFNLLALGLLALLVGAFLVFDMAQFAVARRRALLGKLRCLGCPARDLLVAVLIEALLLGLLGGALGLLGGRLLAGSLVHDVARTVSTLYGPVGRAPVVTLDLPTAALALLVAALAALVASWGPARAAAATPPIVVAGGAPPEPRPRARTALLLLLAGALLLLPRGGALLLPSIAVVLLLLGSAMLVPLLLGRALRLVPRRPLPMLAADRLGRSLARAGAAAGALAMPVAMTIAIVIMVGSFRSEVRAWAGDTLRGDLYVAPLFQELAPSTARLPDALVAAIEARPDVASADCRRVVEETAGEHPFLVMGARLDDLAQHATLRMLQGGEQAAAFERAKAGEALVTEPLARRLNLSPGSTLTLAGRDGERRVRVAAVFQDFGLDRGYALLGEPTFLDIYGETGVANMALRLQPGADVERVRTELAALWPDAEFRTVATLRAGVLAAFDETFAITWVMQAISTVLALVGVLTALLCLHLERRAELGVLRALGASTRTIGGLLLVEALLILLVDCVLALPLGVALAWILVAVVNTRSFGWSYPLIVPVWPVASVLLLAVAAGLLAGVVPWLLVRRARVAELLAEGAA